MHFRRAAVRFTAGVLLAATLITPAAALNATVDAEGSTLRLRAESNTASKILRNLAHGTEVEVVSALENGWYQVDHNGLTGYVSGDYLVVEETAETPDAAPAPEEDSAPAEETACVRVTASALNVRTGPGTEYDKAGKLYGGRVVEVQEEVDGWYKVAEGYISAEYTIPVTEAELAASSKGQEIANYALQFVGYPYVYGGSTPKGFDCSGFTSYVYKQFGYSLNRTASNQLDNGTPVAMSELQPGDLVLFKKAGTGSKRASHVGLYIGNGEFVHASTATVGVIVSSLDQAYYTTGFVGGRRIV